MIKFFIVIYILTLLVIIKYRNRKKIWRILRLVYLIFLALSLLLFLNLPTVIQYFDSHTFMNPLLIFTVFAQFNLFIFCSVLSLRFFDFKKEIDKYIQKITVKNYE